MSLLGAELAFVEFELSALKDVSIDTAALARAR